MIKYIILCGAFSLHVLFSAPAFASSRQQIVSENLDRFEKISIPQVSAGREKTIWDLKLEQYAEEENRKQAIVVDQIRSKTARHRTKARGIRPKAAESQPDEPQAKTVRQNQPEVNYIRETRSDESYSSRERAMENEISLAGFYISGGYEGNHIHYSEWHDTDKLDEDFGNMHGFYYIAGYRSPNYYDFLMGKPYIEGYYRHYSNVIHYKGALIGGGPYDCDQRSKIKQFGVKLGGYTDFARPGEVYGYFDIGKRTWDRGEDQPPDYHEKYYWPYVGMGGGLNHLFFSKLSVGMDTEVMIACRPKMRVNTMSATFKLGNVWGAQVTIPLKYYILKNLSLDLTPGYAYWNIQDSDVVAVNGTPLYEPESKTNLKFLQAGITYVF